MGYVHSGHTLVQILRLHREIDGIELILAPVFPQIDTPKSQNANIPPNDSHNANNAAFHYHTRLLGYPQPYHLYSRT